MSVRRPLLLIAAALAGASCSSDQPLAADLSPSIVIAGLVDGATYDGPVAVLVTTDRGDYQVTLDGQPFASGDTVRSPGAHVLLVTARSGLAVTTRTLHFTLRAPAGGVLIIRMFDLGANDAGGGGDAILLTDSSAAGMTHVMIDAGPSGANASDPGFVERQLAQLHVDTLAVLLLTHAHDDHYGGMAPILSAVHVQRFVYNGQVRTLASYNSVVAQARLIADSVITLAALRHYDLGASATPARLTLIPPLATHLATATDDGDLLNDGSIGARLQLGTFAIFLAGDGETGANGNWRVSYPDLIAGITVLKVGHHGANNAIFDDGFGGISTWLDQLAPRVSIVSSNGTTHPRVGALARLLSQVNSHTYCTNVHGNIEIRVSRAGDYGITVARNAGMACVAGSGATT